VIVRPIVSRDRTIALGVLGFAAWPGSDGYQLEADEDVLTLRRQDGSPVVTLARGPPKEGASCESSKTTARGIPSTPGRRSTLSRSGAT
jgi:hypothetical protein